MAANVKFKLDGIEKLESDMKRLGKVPQVAVNRAAKAGAQIAYQDAKQKAPVDEGELKRGIVLVKESNTGNPGKRVYQVVMSRFMNDIFVKLIKNPTDMNRGVDKNRAYYPAAQEWGFFNHWAKRFLPGYHFLRNAIDNNKGKIEKTILDTLGKDIDKVLKG